MSRSAASYYYPDEPVELYEPEYSEAVPLPECPPRKPEVEPPFHSSHLSLLPCVRDLSALPEPFLPVELRTIDELEALADEQFIESLALRFSIACRKIRSEWSSERIAKVKPQLYETSKALQALIKPEPRRRRFNASHPMLFD